MADEVEGRHEVEIRAGGYAATLPVLCPLPARERIHPGHRPGGGGLGVGRALYDPQTGRVKVYIGRPEFVELARRAQREKI